MENWAEIRRRVRVDGQSKRSVCREFDIHGDTLPKILDHPEPPGYRRTAPRPRPKIDPFLGVIPPILEADKKAPPEATTQGTSPLRAAVGRARLPRWFDCREGGRRR